MCPSFLESPVITPFLYHLGTYLFWEHSHELLYMMEHIDISVKEYHDDVVKGIITKVVVLSTDRIRITFDNNMEMEQELPSE